MINGRTIRCSDRPPQLTFRLVEIRRTIAAAAVALADAIERALGEDAGPK
jgi:hypothetical protein